MTDAIGPRRRVLNDLERVDTWIVTRTVICGIETTHLFVAYGNAVNHNGLVIAGVLWSIYLVVGAGGAVTACEEFLSWCSRDCGARRGARLTVYRGRSCRRR